MRFTESEIQLASRLRGAGLQWQPQPGHFVFDIDGVVKAGSPFQASVHLMTSRNALETIAGGADALREGFTWLPTWYDARRWLADYGVSHERVLKAWSKGLEQGQSDHEALYWLMLEELERHAATNNA